jgi:hypothetical protein
MNAWSAITWDTARAGGFVAYILVTVSIALGLALSLRWYSRSWPRWATTDLHRHITLLALIFTGIHSLAIFLDPFMAFTPAEVLVPLMSHYRPIWTALGIVAAYLLLAIWLSERIQKQVGYAWWRRLHYLTFGIWGLATIHGLTTGTDTRTGWALLIYGGSALLVGWLLTIRLLGRDNEPAPHPRIATVTTAAALAALIFVIAGPLRPGWNAFANNGKGSGARGAGISAAPSGLVVPFNAQLQGSVSQSGGSGIGGNQTLQINATLSGGEQGNLQIVLDGQPDGNGSLVVSGGRVTLSPQNGAAACSGSVVSFDGSQMVALCHESSGKQVRLDMSLQGDGSGNVSGTVQGS